MSPLPRGITWRSKQLEQLLDGTNQVVVPKPFEIGIARVLWLLITERSLLMVGGGKRLKDVMPPDLHARFALQRAKYTGDDAKWERFRPIIAAAGRVSSSWVVDPTGSGRGGARARQETSRAHR